jgi:hypothetical protein
LGANVTKVEDRKLDNRSKLCRRSAPCWRSWLHTHPITPISHLPAAGSTPRLQHGARQADQQGPGGRASRSGAFEKADPARLRLNTRKALEDGEWRPRNSRSPRRTRRSSLHPRCAPLPGSSPPAAPRARDSAGARESGGAAGDPLPHAPCHTHPANPLATPPLPPPPLPHTPCQPWLVHTERAQAPKPCIPRPRRRWFSSRRSN